MLSISDFEDKDYLLYNENCLDTMNKMTDNFIDLTVTSPPYDNLRDYNGYEFPFEDIAKELYRVTKQGGVVVWIVNDATIKGSETGTSFKQALFFKEIGFNLHDTMIWQKSKKPLNHNRYEQQFEFMFVFSKGIPLNFNGIKDRKNSQYGKSCRASFRDKDGLVKKSSSHNKSKVAKFGLRYNVWKINPCLDPKNRVGHPAPFPMQLANDHIISWSNEGDIIYDPFSGSGTTGMMAIKNKRKSIMSEMSSEYCEIIKTRIKQQLEQTSLF